MFNKIKNFLKKKFGKKTEGSLCEILGVPENFNDIRRVLDVSVPVPIVRKSNFLDGIPKDFTPYVDKVEVMRLAWLDNSENYKEAKLNMALEAAKFV